VAEVSKEKAENERPEAARSGRKLTTDAAFESEHSLFKRLMSLALRTIATLAALVVIICIIGWMRGRGAPNFLLTPEITWALLGSSLVAALALSRTHRLPRALRALLAPALAFAIFSLWIVAGAWISA
jgi:hypothetical protein